MNKQCPEHEKRIHEKEKHKIVIGIDQSYKNSGISICRDGKLTTVKSIHLDHLKDNTSKRKYLTERLSVLFAKIEEKKKYEVLDVCVILERIRLRSQKFRSQKFISINYIKSMGALNAVIVDCAKQYGIPVYSVETRSWKAAVVGTSKPQANKYGIDPEKWPTIKFVKELGFEQQILLPVSDRKKKGVIVRNGKRYTYNDDAADSACIALYGFLPEQKRLLELEH